MTEGAIPPSRNVVFSPTLVFNINMEPKLLIRADIKAIERSERGMFWNSVFLATAGALMWAGVWMRHISLDLFVTVLGVGIGTLLIAIASLHFFDRKNRQKMKRALPLIYTFQQDGFTSHLDNKNSHFQWDDMKDLTYHEHGITFNFKPNKKVVSVSIIYTSPEDLLSILKHVKKYAPEKLSKDIMI